MPDRKPLFVRDLTNPIHTTAGWRNLYTPQPVRWCHHFGHSPA